MTTLTVELDVLGALKVNRFLAYTGGTGLMIPGQQQAHHLALRDP